VREISVVTMATHVLSVAWQGHTQQAYQLCQHEGQWYKQHDNYVLFYMQAQDSAFRYWNDYAITDEHWTATIDSTVEFAIEHCEVTAGQAALLLSLTYLDTQGLLHARFRKIEWERVRGIILKLQPLPQEASAALAI